MQEKANRWLGRYEEPFMARVAESAAAFMSPDVATAMGALSCAAAFAAFLQLPRPWAFIVPVFMVLSNYLFDGVDGKIARITGRARGRGWLIDKAADWLSSCLFAAGYAEALFGIGALAAAAVSLVNLLHLAVCVKRGVVEKTGGTEARVLAVAACLAALFLS